jgi:hypothetical protein
VADAMVASASFQSLRVRLIQAKKRSTTQRRADLEALLVGTVADDLDDEVEIGGLVHQLEAIVGGMGETQGQRLRIARRASFLQKRCAA